MHDLVLSPGRERPVRAGHPWIFSRAIGYGLDAVAPGGLVRVRAHDGTFVAVGYANPRTAIAVRVLALEEAVIDEAFVARRIDAALALRAALLPETHACRVVNGEGDRLPGVVVDRYGDVLVCQFLTAGAARLAPAIVGALETALRPRSVYERSEGAVRREEGLEDACGLRRGDAPPVPLEIEEAGARYLVDVVRGQKTGFFLDQREARTRLRTLARGRRVLNAFGYTGAFAIAAGLGGADRVVSIDASQPALALARAAWAANGLDPARARWVAADVFEHLRAASETYDLAVIDPPALVRRRTDVEAGLRAYKDVNLQALRRLEPGGLLLTCSCSQHVAPEAFRQAVLFAAADARRAVQVVAEWGHPPDHPVLLAHPEGRYLKGLLLRAADG